MPPRPDETQDTLVVRVHTDEDITGVVGRILSFSDGGHRGANLLTLSLPGYEACWSVRTQPRREVVAEVVPGYDLFRRTNWRSTL